MYITLVDKGDKEKKIWKPKGTLTSETCSVSETEKKNEIIDLRDKTPRAETSFTRHGMGLQEEESKPIQNQKTATATTSHERKNREKDKSCGPGKYELEEPIVLKKRFQQLESNEEILLRSSTVSPAALIDNSHSSGSASDDDLPGYTPVSSDKQLTRLWFKYQFNTKTVGSVWYSALSTTSKLAKKKNEIIDLRDKTPRAETSFTRHGMGLQEEESKPIQNQKTATATTSHERKNREKDKSCGPGKYELEEPIVLKKRFQQLESNEEISLELLLAFNPDLFLFTVDTTAWRRLQLRRHGETPNYEVNNTVLCQIHCRRCEELSLFSKRGQDPKETI
ncbi:hypothetical protein HID58_042171 [Brassica napus]|uniref:Uncharacterized protein n=1 Tax=Brassica napus TaxID=3708 RepID=A0ABQ8BD57_BRANA|nr:hypothetical protein HID58_042171 [Brassica napus]